MEVFNDMRHFNFWCHKVLPLVYDDSLSYYEVLCKVVKYINDLIEQDKIITDELEALRADMEKVEYLIDNFNTEFAERVIQDYLATMIFIEISDSGYIVYYIPERWEDITFQTTGLDIPLDGYDFGHLTLSY